MSLPANPSAISFIHRYKPPSFRILTHLYWWFNDFSGHSGEKHIRWIWAEDPVWVSSWGQCCLPKGLSCCVSPTATHSIHLTQNEEIRLSLLDAVFCFSHNLLDSKINTLLSLCQDPNLLNPVHGIVQSVVYHEESPPQYQTSYLQSKAPHISTLELLSQSKPCFACDLILTLDQWMSVSVNVFERVVSVCDWRITSLLTLLISTAFGFNGLWRFAGPFSKVCDTEFALKMQ